MPVLLICFQFFSTIIHFFYSPIHEAEKEEQVIVLTIVLFRKEQLVKVSHEVVDSFDCSQIGFGLVMLVSPKLGFTGLKFNSLQVW